MTKIKELTVIIYGLYSYRNVIGNSKANPLGSYRRFKIMNSKSNSVSIVSDKFTNAMTFPIHTRISLIAGVLLANVYDALLRIECIIGKNTSN